MALIVVGTSHRTAPLAVREKLVIPAASAGALLGEVSELCDAREANSTLQREAQLLEDGE